MKKIRILPGFGGSQKDFKENDVDPILTQYAKRLEVTKTSLRSVHERLSKKTQAMEPLVQSGRKLGRSFNTYGEYLSSIKGEESQLGEFLSRVGVFETLLNDLLEKLNINIIEKLEDPVNEFIKGEISAAEQEKKQYEKAKTAFEAADSKLRQLKGREDAKAFDTEKERNVLQERYIERRDEAQTALIDAFEKNEFYTLEKLCDFIDGYHSFFKQGLDAIEQIRSKSDHYRQYIARKKKEYRTEGEGAEGEEGAGEVVKQGWLQRCSSRKGSNWKKSWVVLKYKYMYYYANPDSALGGVVRLTHCSVDQSTRYRNIFALLSMEDYIHTFFSAKSENDMAQWMEAVRSCIEEGEDHETRDISGKEGIKGNAWIEEDECPEDEEEDEGLQSKDPIARMYNQFLREERRYVNCLTRITKMYMIPLTADPKLKTKILPDELEAIFGNIKFLTMMHTSLLKQLETTQVKEISTIFLQSIKDLDALYLEYVSNLANGMYSLNVCKQRAKVIKQFIEEREELLGEGNELPTLLALPVARISQCAMFLDKLIQAGIPDHTLEDAMEAMKNLAVKLNQSSATSAHLARILDVRRRLLNYEGNLLDPQRRFFREGAVQIQLPAPPAPPGAGLGDSTGKVKQQKGMVACYLFLFNDLLVITKPPTISRATYKVIGQLEMYKAKLTDDEKGSSTFKIEEKQRGKHTQSRVFIVQTEEKSQWMTSLLNAIDEMRQTRKTYGIPLESLMSSVRERGRDIPSVVEKVTDWIIRYGLTQEGIFRKAGRLDTIEDYKDLLNQGKEAEFPPDEDPYVVAGVMNHLFMELPEPLLTNNLYEPFIEAARQEGNDSGMVITLKDLIQKLPSCNRFVLQHLMSFLQLVIEHEDENKMGASNLAIVFGPTLLGSGKSESMFSEFTANQRVIETMILNYHILFNETEEQRKLVKVRLMEEEEAQKAKLEMQQKRIHERLGSMSVPSHFSTMIQQQVSADPIRERGISMRTSGYEINLQNPPSSSPVQGGSGSQIGIGDRNNSKYLPRKPLPRPPADSPPETSPAANSISTGGSSPASIPSSNSSGMPRQTVQIGVVKPVPPRRPLPSIVTPVLPTPSLPASSPTLPTPSPLPPVPAAVLDSKSDEDTAVATIKALPPGSIVKQGWLTKKGGQRRNWKTRWFVLKTNELSYYNAKKVDSKAKGTIVLSGVTVKPSSHKEFCFAMSTHERTYLMAGKDAAEQEEWIAAVNACLKSLA